MDSPFVAEKKTVAAGSTERDQVWLTYTLDKDRKLTNVQLRAVGCLKFLEAVTLLRQHLPGTLLSEVRAPEGTDHVAMLLREVIARAQGNWAFPYDEEELCHCRAVPTLKVDRAIIAGCHSVDQIKLATSASTSCGTCRPDIDKVLRYRRTGCI